MSKQKISEGKSIVITGQTATIEVGSVYRRAGTSAIRVPGGSNFYQVFWPGVVVDQILGTSVTLQDVGGRPVIIGDGASAESQGGDGRGDMDIEGVHQLQVVADNGGAIIDASPVYAHVADVTDPSASVTASGVTGNNGYAISGALVGFAEGASYTSTTPPFNGLVVVDCKLLGAPLHGLNLTGPAESKA